MWLSAATKIMQGELRGQDVPFLGAATDTRLLNAGQLFFAWQGEHHDGHQFLEQAASKGATAAVVERFSPVNLPQIKVTNSQKALGVLAKAWRKEWKGQCVALTGSNGKTTVKELLRHIFAEVGSVQATEGNLNNHVGCPLTILGLRPTHQYAVLEMGANHPKEIAYLSKIAQPNVAIINNVGHCHLEGFGSLTGVAEAKGEIFLGLNAQGIRIINADDTFAEYWQNLSTTPMCRFAINAVADVYATDIHVQQDCQTFMLHYQTQQVSVSLNLLGQHNVYNALAAAAAALMSGVSLEVIALGINKMQAVQGRLQRLCLTKDITLVNDAYNANPNSVHAAIDVMRTLAGTYWLVLGDMKELGFDAAMLHEQIGQYAKTQGVQRLFALGELTQATVKGFGKGATHYATHAELTKALQMALSEADKPLTVLVKGSFSMGMQQIVENLKAAYSEE